MRSRDSDGVRYPRRCMACRAYLRRDNTDDLCAPCSLSLYQDRLRELTRRASDEHRPDAICELLATGPASVAVLAMRTNTCETTVLADLRALASAGRVRRARRKHGGVRHWEIVETATVNQEGEA